MSKPLIAGLVLALSMSLPKTGWGADSADYSKEAVVIQSVTTEVSFAPDGARDYQQAMSAKVQSEAAVRQFGVLAFSYSSCNEQCA